MKKIIFLSLLSFLFLLSCNKSNNREPKPGNRHLFSDDDISSDIRYFKDPETNKCFAERGHSDLYSFTCVECDSLVLEKIKSLEYDYKNN